MHTWWRLLLGFHICSAVIYDGWWVGAWWNSLLDCVLQISNTSEIFLVWIYVWPNNSSCIWLLSDFVRCCHQQIRLLWRCLSLLGWVSHLDDCHARRCTYLTVDRNGSMFFFRCAGYDISYGFVFEINWSIEWRLLGRSLFRTCGCPSDIMISPCSDFCSRLW